MKRAMAVLAAAVLAVMAFPMVAAAGEVELEGRGVLAAEGTGKAEIEGRLEFHGGAQQGVLVIEDRAGDATVEVTGHGRRIDEGNGRVRYVGFDGRAHIQGSNVAIELSGRDIRLIVWGAGEATLRGHGTYRTRHGAGSWSPEGTLLRFEEAAEVGDAGQ